MPGLTLGEQDAEEQVEELMKDPEWRQLVNQTRHKLMTGQYGEERDYVAQLHRRWWTDGQVYSFIAVWSRMQEGLIDAWRIPVGEGPLPDREWRKNGQTLLKKLPKGFGASVPKSSSGNECDGVLTYNPKDRHPWQTVVTHLPEPFGFNTGKLVEVPLEIGYTKPSTTLLHFVNDGCLARWPYDRTMITLYIANSKFWDLKVRVVKQSASLLFPDISH